VSQAQSLQFLRLYPVCQREHLLQKLSKSGLKHLVSEEKKMMTPEPKPHNHHKEHQGHFFNGLLVGLILGFALALLFTTKRGRQMVKALTEEGLDSISELRRRMDTLEVMIDEDEYVEEPKEAPKAKNGVKSKEVVEEEIDDEEPTKKDSKRRFFKGIRKN